MKKKIIICFLPTVLLCIIYFINIPKNNDYSLNSEIPELLDTTPVPSINKQTNAIPFPSDKDISLNSMHDTILKICSQPRSMNSPGIHSAKNILVNILNSYNYKTNIQSFDIYKQDMHSTNVNESVQDYFRLNPYNSEIIGTGENIIASNDDDSNKPTLYITAHYDTTKDTYGIMDNGTGTAVCIELARLLKNYKFDFNIVYVLFSSEEYYRYGSRYFVSQLINNEVSNILGCINIDMIGQKDAGAVVAKTVFCRPNALSVAFEDIIPLSHNDSGGLSDDLSFYFAKIPVIHLFNESPNPTLLHGEEEINLLDIKQLKTTISNILLMLNNFNINNYYTLINSNYSETHTDLKENYKIDNYKLEELKYNLLEDGYSSQIECKFVYKKKSLKLFECDQRFDNTKKTSLCTKKLINTHIWYSYLDTTSGINEICYGSNYYPSIGGTIETSLPEDELVKFLERRYDNFENTIVKGFTFDEYIIN